MNALTMYGAEVMPEASPLHFNGVMSATIRPMTTSSHDISSPLFGRDSQLARLTELYNSLPNRPQNQPRTNRLHRRTRSSNDKPKTQEDHPSSQRDRSGSDIRDLGDEGLGDTGED